IHHFICNPTGTYGGAFDIADQWHNSEHHVSDGIGDDGWNRGLQQHFDRRFLAQPLATRNAAKGSRCSCKSNSIAACSDDLSGNGYWADSHGAKVRNRRRSICAFGTRHHWRSAGVGCRYCVFGSGRLSLVPSQRGNTKAGVDRVINNRLLASVLLLSTWCGAQETSFDRAIHSGVWVSASQQSVSATPMPTPPQASTGRVASATSLSLSRKDAEALALKNNPAISVARLNALASQQVVREVRSNLWPVANANLTAVDSHDDSRIAAGGLNNPIIFERAAAGATVSQLITDFGRTTNLVASARLQSKAEDQNAIATKEQVLLAVDRSFYNALQGQAVLKVAEQTVSSRQLLADQVSALARSKLKSDLDVSFAKVNLAQAKLLQLDAENNAQAAMAALSAILGFPGLERMELIEDTEPLSSPAASPDDLIAEAISKRPEILAAQFETESEHKLQNA